MLDSLYKQFPVKYFLSSVSLDILAHSPNRGRDTGVHIKSGA